MLSKVKGSDKMYTRTFLEAWEDVAGVRAEIFVMDQKTGGWRYLCLLLKKGYKNEPDN